MMNKVIFVVRVTAGVYEDVIDTAIYATFDRNDADTFVALENEAESKENGYLDDEYDLCGFEYPALYVEEVDFKES